MDCSKRTFRVLFMLVLAWAAPALAAVDKPNILVIWGDDIGIWNISHYSHGLMGYQTPAIDRIAREGMMFTDYYGEQSCTAGRSAFITGQHPIRTGLTKVGVPGADLGPGHPVARPQQAAVEEPQPGSRRQAPGRHEGRGDPQPRQRHRRHAHRDRRWAVRACLGASAQPIRAISGSSGS